MQVRLISITPDAEKTMTYCARVSNPANQNSENYKLLAYCIKHKHWSVFEMANMNLEITTSRAISAQILRHNSARFQEFSQRYAEAIEFEIYEARRQDVKNRQNSIDDLPEETKEWFYNAQKTIQADSLSLYKEALCKGIAKECARFLLPLSTSTTLYMNGNVRSWIHYIEPRSAVETQLEHRVIAEAAKKIFCEQLPIVAEALGWR